MEETRIEAIEERRNKGYFISMGTKFSIVLCRESQSVKMLIPSLILDSTHQREAESLQ